MSEITLVIENTFQILQQEGHVESVAVQSTSK